MSVEDRPSFADTPERIITGLPILEFAPQITGGYDPYRMVGILDAVELGKVVDVGQLPNRHSGVTVIAREWVKTVEPSLTVGLYDHVADNLALTLGSSVNTAVGASTPSIADEEIRLAATLPFDGFLDLVNLNVDESTVVLACTAIVDEAVGTGDGTTGDGSGDFSLDFAPLVIGDVTAVTVAGVAYTPIAVGAAAAGNEVEIVVGTGATSGDMQFFVGGVAADVTGAILATYTPSHSFVLNTDFTVDQPNGRVRLLGPDEALRANQYVDADYDHTTYAHQMLRPFTQTTFQGKARIKHLSDIGMNFIWPIPNVSILITDDAMTFDADNPTISTLQVKLIDNGGTAPFGELELYPEQ